MIDTAVVLSLAKRTVVPGPGWGTSCYGLGAVMIGEMLWYAWWDHFIFSKMGNMFVYVVRGHGFLRLAVLELGYPSRLFDLI